MIILISFGGGKFLNKILNNIYAFQMLDNKNSQRQMILF